MNNKTNHKKFSYEDDRIYFPDYHCRISAEPEMNEKELKEFCGRIAIGKLPNGTEFCYMRDKPVRKCATKKRKV